MNNLIESVRSSGVVVQGLFLMVVGMSFVFAVQVIFYLMIRLWPKEKEKQE